LTLSRNFPGESLYINISSIKDECLGGDRFWALIVDDCTAYYWSYFLKSKDQLKIKILALVEELKDKGRFFMYIILDDAGENASIERACKG
jgi:hypothetical protein